MLEEKDLTSEERVRLECLEIASRVAETGAGSATVIYHANVYEKYIRNGVSND